MRADLGLTHQDIEHLDANYPEWETAEGRYLIIKGFKVPEGYNHEIVSVAINIPIGYPKSALDMAYFLPHLELKNGRKMNRVENTHMVAGQLWQRWSRHRNNDTKWRIGIDNVTTHLLYICSWLKVELNK